MLDHDQCRPGVPEDVTQPEEPVFRQQQVRSRHQEDTDRREGQRQRAPLDRGDRPTQGGSVNGTRQDRDDDQRQERVVAEQDDRRE